MNNHQNAIFHQLDNFIKHSHSFAMTIFHTFKNDLKGDLNKTLFSPKSEAFEALQYLVTRLV
jgi:hypothetical protein